jgi:hypothetical protein
MVEKPHLLLAPMPRLKRLLKKSVLARKESLGD